MNENEFDAAATNLRGKIEDTVGGLTGDGATQVRGKADQVTGTAQSTYGSLIDEVSERAKSIANSTKANPLTALAIALSVGYLFRMMTSRR